MLRTGWARTPAAAPPATDPDAALANMKWVEQVGRTQFGLNDDDEDLRANAYMDFRQDVNASDPDGTQRRVERVDVCQTDLLGRRVDDPGELLDQAVGRRRGAAGSLRPVAVGLQVHLS